VGLEFRGFRGLAGSLGSAEAQQQILGILDTQDLAGIPDILLPPRDHLGSQDTVDHFLELQGLADIPVTQDQEYLVSLGIPDAVDLAGSLDVVVILVSVDSRATQDSAAGQVIQDSVVLDVADIRDGVGLGQVVSLDIQAGLDFRDIPGSVEDPGSVGTADSAARADTAVSLDQTLVRLDIVDFAGQEPVGSQDFLVMPQPGAGTRDIVG
jgi:hypothetical protein